MNIKYLILISCVFFLNERSFAQEDSLPKDGVSKLNKIYKKGETYNKYRLYYTPRTPLSDYENLYTQSQISFIDSIIINFEKRTDIEIAIVTLDSIDVRHLNFDSLITVLGNRWKIGKKGKDNGIIIGISSILKKIRISTGYGIEPILSDFETKQIIDKVIIPEFKKANFFNGLKFGLQKIISLLEEKSDRTT